MNKAKNAFILSLIIPLIASCDFFKLDSSVSSSEHETLPESSSFSSSRSGVDGISVSLSTDDSSTSVVTSSSSSSSTGSSSSSVPVGSSSSISSSAPAIEYMYTPKATDSVKVYSIEQTNYYGDATLFKYGDFEVLIDGGNQWSATQLADCLSDNVTDHKLEVVILTHSHSDHYGGFTYGSTAAANGGTLAQAGITSVGYIVDSGYGSISYWESVKSYYTNKGAVYSTILSLTKDHIHDAIWNIAPKCSLQWLYSATYLSDQKSAADSKTYNNNSVLCNLKFGTYEWTMLGDAQDIEITSMLSYYKSQTFVSSGDKVVFKACHHCSGTAHSGNTTTLMNFLSPSYGFTSSGIIAANSAEGGTAMNEDSSGPADTPATDQHPYKNAAECIIKKTGSSNFFWNGTAGTILMSLDSSFGSFEMSGLGRVYGLGYNMNGTLVPTDSEKSTPLMSTQWASTSAFVAGGGGTL